MMFNAGDVIAYFDGAYCDSSAVEKMNAERQKYVVRIPDNANLYLDCYHKFKEGLSKASYSNSSSNSRHPSNLFLECYPNCRLKYNPNEKETYLVAVENIQPGTEIIRKYDLKWI